MPCIKYKILALMFVTGMKMRNVNHTNRETMASPGAAEVSAYAGNRIASSRNLFRFQVRAAKYGLLVAWFRGIISGSGGQVALGVPLADVEDIAQETLL